MTRETRARTIGVPVLLTSGYAEQAIHDADMEGLTVLRKPYGLSDLSGALESALLASKENDKRMSG